MQSKNKAKQSRFCSKGYWTPGMFSALNTWQSWRDKGIELLLLSRDTTCQPQGARIDAGERSNSVKGQGYWTLFVI